MNKIKLLTIIMTILIMNWSPVVADQFEFEPIFEVKVGTEETSLSCNVVEGEIPYGFLQGPTAFLTTENDEILVCDTLNQRLILFSQKGKIIKIYDFNKICPSELLENKPVVFHMTYGMTGRIYLADAFNNIVFAMDKKGKFIGTFGKAGKAAGEYYQINQLHTDMHDNVYVEDLSSMKTVVYDKKGKFLREHKGITSTSVDKYGNMAVLLFQKDPFKREIAVYGSNGDKGDILGHLKDKEEIKYCATLGYDSNNFFHMTYDTDSFRYFTRIDLSNRVQKQIRTAQIDPGIDAINPQWISPSGDIYTIKASPEKFVFMKLKKVKKENEKKRIK